MRDGLSAEARKTNSKLMKTHSTNYFNTFIEVAEDCPARFGETPPLRGANRSVANHQFEILSGHPCEFTSDDVLFSVHAIRRKYRKQEMQKKRADFFSRGQPCFRASPLTKRYGFGIHSDENGKIAMYGVETEEYSCFLKDDSIKKVSAMRAKRAK
ncbi:MAG TPA: DUF6157 family protein [Pricia sp.]|nr:DUF6157 family protein [Pricia sp.]